MSCVSFNPDRVPRKLVLLAFAGVLMAFAWASVPSTLVAQQIPADTSERAQTGGVTDTMNVDQVRSEMERRRAARSSSERSLQPDRRGTTLLADWPRSLPDLLDRMGRRAPALLPKLDTLTIDYAYTTGQDMVEMQFGIQWQPGQTVLYEGSVISRSEAPPDVRMTTFEILLDVVKGGQKVAETLIAVDSMALPPSPGYYEFEVRVPYEQVFLDVEASDAELYLRDGVDLERPLIERIGFRPFQNGVPVGVVGQMERESDASERSPEGPPRRDSPPVVYSSRTRVLIGWRIGPDPYYVGPVGRPVPPRSDRDRRVVERPETTSGDGNRHRRGETAGREATPGREIIADRRGDDGDSEAGARTGRGSGEEESASGDRTSAESSGGAAPDSRTGRSGTSDGEGKSDGEEGKDKRDDDEDDDNLAPAALGAAAVVAGIAYFGGTVGVYGTGETPIGLAAGVTKKRWGLQLQAAINSEVIDQQGTQRLNAKLMGFYDVLGGSPVQPAVGAGVQFQAVEDKTTVDPALSFGAVVNTGRIVIFGGYDVARETPEFGVTYNFR